MREEAKKRVSPHQLEDPIVKLGVVLLGEPAREVDSKMGTKTWDQTS